MAVKYTLLHELDGRAGGKCDSVLRYDVMSTIYQQDDQMGDLLKYVHLGTPVISSFRCRIPYIFPIFSLYIVSF